MKNKNTFRSEMLEDRSLLAVETCEDKFQLTASCVLETGFTAAKDSFTRINGGSMVLSSDESDLTKTYFNLNNATLQFATASTFASIFAECSLINGQSGAAGSDTAIDACKFTNSYSGAKTKITPGFLAPVSFPLVTSPDIKLTNDVTLPKGELKFEGPAILTWNIDPDRCQSTFGLEWDVKVTDANGVSPLDLDFSTEHVGSGVTALHNPNINFDLCKSTTELNSEGVFEIKPQKASDPLDVRQQKLNKINNLFPLNI